MRVRGANRSDIALERHSDSEFPNTHVRILNVSTEHAVHGLSNVREQSMTGCVGEIPPSTWQMDSNIVMDQLMA